MCEQPFEHRVVNAPRERQLAISVERRSGAGTDPVVEQPVTRSRVERDEFSVRADPGHICDPAHVQHDQWFRQGDGKGGVVGRCQRRALSSRFHVCGAEIIRDRQAGLPCQKRCVADLPRSPFRRPMQDRLPVEPDQVGSLS